MLRLRLIATCLQYRHIRDVIIALVLPLSLVTTESGSPLPTNPDPPLAGPSPGFAFVVPNVLLVHFGQLGVVAAVVHYGLVGVVAAVMRFGLDVAAAHTFRFGPVDSRPLFAPE